jgi:hypothetical protein
VFEFAIVKCALLQVNNSNQTTNLRPFPFFYNSLRCLLEPRGTLENGGRTSSTDDSLKNGWLARSYPSPGLHANLIKLL